MTRDEEIRHDLERQWREADAEKAGQDLDMVAEDIREFVASVTDFAKRKNAQDRQRWLRRRSTPPPHRP